MSADIKMDIRGATGGFLKTSAIICGGYRGPRFSMSELALNDYCYLIDSNKVTPIGHKMLTKRVYASSVTMYGTSLWITGGSNKIPYLSSSEFLDLDGTKPGPYLPIPLAHHATINVKSYLTMVIGGETDKYDRPCFYDV